jgi:3-deoxy-D-manno-octulosonic-acid transferase
VSDPSDKYILIIDNIGMLSRLYKYGQFAYIGGGFNRSGIHNTLEAAVYGKPVIFGPNYQKFNEAKGLLAAGGAFTYNQPAELISLVHGLLSAPPTSEAAGKAAGDFVKENRGATQRIMEGISQIVSERSGQTG